MSKDQIKQVVDAIFETVEALPYVVGHPFILMAVKVAHSLADSAIDQIVVKAQAKLAAKN